MSRRKKFKKMVTERRLFSAVLCVFGWTISIIENSKKSGIQSSFASRMYLVFPGLKASNLRQGRGGSVCQREVIRRVYRTEGKCSRTKRLSKFGERRRISISGFERRSLFKRQNLESNPLSRLSARSHFKNTFVMRGVVKG